MTTTTNYKICSNILFGSLECKQFETFIFNLSSIYDPSLHSKFEDGIITFNELSKGFLEHLIETITELTTSKCPHLFINFSRNIITFNELCYQSTPYLENITLVTENLLPKNYSNIVFCIHRSIPLYQTRQLLSNQFDDFSSLCDSLLF